MLFCQDNILNKRYNLTDYLITFQSELINDNHNKNESPVHSYKNSPSENKKSQTERISREKGSSNSEFNIENLENNFYFNAQDEGVYEAQLTGNFNSKNSNTFKKFIFGNNSDYANNSLNKICLTENIKNNKYNSFKNENNIIFKKPCFFCLRNSKKFNFETEKYREMNIGNNTPRNSKNYDESMTEKLKILMESFNLEKRFKDKSEEIKENFNNTKSLNFKNQFLEISNYDFNNYYPKNLSLIILDLRISLDNKDKFYDYKAGFLPMTVIIEQEELIDEHVKIK